MQLVYGWKISVTDALIFVLGLFGILYTLGNLILRIKMILERGLRAQGDGEGVAR